MGTLFHNTELASRVGDSLGHDLASLLRNYFRVEVEGIENIPNQGPGIILPNHSGFAGVDAIMLVHIISETLGRDPKILAHRGYFDWSKILGLISKKFNMVRATLTDGLEQLKNNELIILFPEGEEGNFKSSLKMYQLQRFHSGFLKMAFQTHCPIIPCLVVGAEEAHFNLGSIDLTPWADRLRLPLPLNLFPFPSKWKISFLKSMSFENYGTKPIQNQKLVTEICEKVRRKMQRELMEELHKRTSIYFPKFSAHKLLSIPGLQ